LGAGGDSAGVTNWALPDVDINYGWGDRIQLKFDTPYALTQDRSRDEPIPDRCSV